MVDFVVIGGGPAGYVAAERAAHAGLSTVVCEKNSLGGVCLNEGCIPSKTLLNSAKIYTQALHGQAYGVTAQGLKLDHEAVIKRKKKVVRTLVAGVQSSVQAAGAVIRKGEARILGRSADGFSVEVDSERIEAKNLLIATGSEAIVPPIPGVKEGVAAGSVITSREALELPAVPARMVVVGGGVIGLEMAEYYATAGSAVTVVEMLPTIAGASEAECAQTLLKAMQKSGITFHLDTKVTQVGPGGVRCANAQGEFEIPADVVLLAIGRRPVSAGFGLEKLDVYTERGAIRVDAQCRTNQPGVYAAGDVNGKSMLAHTAYREAEVAVNTILGIQDTMRYDAIPAVIYTHPEIAGVGYDEASAAKAGIEIITAKLSMRYSGRFVAETDGDGFIKVIVEKKSRRLIGTHIVGSYASETIYGAAALIELGARVEDVRRIVFPHPTVAELLREAMFTI